LYVSSSKFEHANIDSSAALCIATAVLAVALPFSSDVHSRCLVARDSRGTQEAGSEDIDTSLSILGNSINRRGRLTE